MEKRLDTGYYISRGGSGYHGQRIQARQRTGSRSSIDNGNAYTPAPARGIRLTHEPNIEATQSLESHTRYPTAHHHELNPWGIRAFRI